ncbi:hypothetical protein A3L12_06760 [Thermococcus sp. P6]|uniref:hypothetical protein n=1 Tax=Thermococcus sp. P6 TaxID=122420 RepID=UPI000B59C311|nr:hypothetical protein [Thermococcus sp. P6]ASJ11024.1 hypothetical protein A3L12_06760 [Thermococcus sp. P6]
MTHVVTLDRERFRALKGKNVEEILRDNLKRVEETLMAEREEELLERKGKLEEKLETMLKEVEELREFYRKALADKEFMMAERERLALENADLRKKVEAKRKELEERPVREGR